MGLRILITGANGFVGRNLVHHFCQDSALSIVATDMHDTLVRLDPAVNNPVTYLSGDLASKEFSALLRNLHNFDCIIHLAAIISQAEDMGTYFSVMDSNINATFLLLETARQHKCRFIFPSTALIYGKNKAPFTEDTPVAPEVFYAVSKHMCEELIRFYNRKYAIPYLIFRAGVFYGPGQLSTSGMFIPSIIAHLLGKKEFAMTAGEQVRDFVLITDFISLLRQALDKTEIGGSFNVGTGQAPTLKEVALMAERLTATQGLLRLGAIAYRSEEVWNYCLDTAKTTQTFNWQAQTGLEQGMQQTIDYQRASRGYGA